MSIPTTTKAITFAKNGGPEVLELTPNHPIPEVSPTEILVKVEYAGVNFFDSLLRSGAVPAPALPFVMGSEIAGTIVRLPTDEAVLNHPEYKKRNYAVGSKVSALQLASHVEYIAVPWVIAVPVPESVSLATAAATHVSGLTALALTTEAYAVKQSDTILVHTVAGGLGLLLTQIAKARGATVIGTTSSDEKAAVAKAAGADHVINYKTEDTVKRVLEITGGKGVEAVFDSVGKDTFEGNFEMLKRKGTFVSVGTSSGHIPPFSPLKLSAKNLKFCLPTIFGYLAEPEDVTRYGRELYELVSNETIKVRVHQEYPFTAQGVQNAHSDLASGTTTGKLVVKIGGQ